MGGQSERLRSTRPNSETITIVTWSHTPCAFSSVTKLASALLSASHMRLTPRDWPEMGSVSSSMLEWVSQPISCTRKAWGHG